MNGIQFRANRLVLVAPQSISDAATASDVINLKDCPVATIVIQFGAMHDSLDMDIQVLSHNSTTASGGEAISTLRYRKQVTTGTWGSWATVTDSKIDVVSGGEIDPTTDDNCIVEIEVRASELEAQESGDKYIYTNYTAGGAYAYLVASHIVLNNQRYQAAVPESAVV